MSPSSFLLALLSLALVSSLVDGATIEETCRRASIGQFGFNYTLCVDSIRNDQIQAGFDVERQALAAVDQALLRAVVAWSKAFNLPRGDGSIAPLLDHCTNLYNVLRIRLLNALDLLQKHPGRSGVIQELVDARNRSNQCPYAFAMAGKPSPLAQESSDVTDMLVIVVAVLGLLPQ